MARNASEASRLARQGPAQVKIKIKKDDQVKVIAGRDKGKTGRVICSGSQEGQGAGGGRLDVKRHTRPNPSKQIKGGIAERESAIAVSNVMVLTSGGVPTRVGYRIEGTGAFGAAGARCAQNRARRWTRKA